MGNSNSGPKPPPGEDLRLSIPFHDETKFSATNLLFAPSKNFKNAYRIHEQVGKGGFATVHRATLQTGYGGATSSSAQQQTVEQQQQPIVSSPGQHRRGAPLSAGGADQGVHLHHDPRYSPNVVVETLPQEPALRGRSSVVSQATSLRSSSPILESPDFDTSPSREGFSGAAASRRIPPRRQSEVSSSLDGGRRAGGTSGGVHDGAPLPARRATASATSLVGGENKPSKSLDRAIKRISKNKMRQLGLDKKTVLHEIEILSSITHRNLMEVFEAYESETEYNFVLEYCPYGDLQKRVENLEKLEGEKRGILEESVASLWMGQILDAVVYLHGAGICHRRRKRIGRSFLGENGGSVVPRQGVIMSRARSEFLLEQGHQREE